MARCLCAESLGETLKDIACLNMAQYKYIRILLAHLRTIGYQELLMHENNICLKRF